MGLDYVVVTSVDRDDLDGLRRLIFARTIRETRARSPRCRIEVLIPDFKGEEAPLRTVLDARPDVLNHNIETVPRLYRTARPGGRYERALQLLDRSRTYAPDIPTKSGLMVGLGEEWDEVVQTLRDLSSVGCRIVTIGQYLRPSLANCADGALLHARRVRRAEAHRPRAGLRPRRVGAAGAQLVPRARADRSVRSPQR